MAGARDHPKREIPIIMTSTEPENYIHAFTNVVNISKGGGDNALYEEELSRKWQITLVAHPCAPVGD